MVINNLNQESFLKQAKQGLHRIVQAASMALVLGVVVLTMPITSWAAPEFKHFMLYGFNVGMEAAPAFVDIDGDGDLDAFVGEWEFGTVLFYRNNGSNQAPDFEEDAAGNPLAGFTTLARAVPTFADIDGDGDADAFVGGAFGTVYFFRNDGTSLAPAFVAVVGASNPLNGVNVGTSANPSFADIDGDGDLDVFVGENGGTVKFYRNNGTSSAPAFVADVAGNPLASVAVASIACPTFVDVDGDGDLDTFVGEYSGALHLFRNNGTNLVPVFVADVAGNPLAGLAASVRVNPRFVDIDADGDQDLFVGENYGSVNFFRNNGTALAPVFAAEAPANPLASVVFNALSSVAFADIDGDGDFDALVGSNAASVTYYRNNGTNVAPSFIQDYAGNPLLGVTLGIVATPTFVDIDADGDLDIFVGNNAGTVAFFRNNGTNLAPALVADVAGNPLSAVAMTSRSAPTFADIDGDGDFDAFIGDGGGTVKLFRNNGTNLVPVFADDIAGNPLAAINVGINAAPTFVDIDEDGDLDVFIGESLGTIKFFRNSGTNLAPVFVADETGNLLAGFNTGGWAIPVFVDIDADGDLDVFSGELYGKIRFYESTPVPIVPSTPTTTPTTPAATTPTDSGGGGCIASIAPMASLTALLPMLGILLIGAGFFRCRRN